MREFDYAIVGGGLCAAYAVDGIRELDPSGSIAVFSEESDPPYHRPPLSKEYLQTAGASRELLHVKPSGWFEGQSNLELFSRTTIDRLDPAGRTVRSESGETFRARRILLATGGTPRRLPVPGAELDGVTTFRTATDAEALREAAPGSHGIALVGAGFIGMEIAASLRKLDLDPLVIDVERRVWSAVFPPSVSGFLRRYFEDRGVRFMLGARVSALEGAGRVSRVLLESGEEIAADIVVVGIGLEPNAALADDAGLGVQDGIVVDAFGETTAAHVYAAGDVARYPDPVFGDLARTEHWDHAKAHGKLVGRNMAGAREAYDHVSYFFTHVFDLGINVFGRTGDADRAIVSGELDSGRSVVYCATDDRLSGTISINATDAMEECRELVRARPTVRELLEKLENPDTEVGELVG
ncbi:MAG: FAD-dependent oxidoreductase [Gemmatimonadetes bacterium]|nr:FAD-dependent oxidoreductase [Gemmatimonadota bacterium]